MVVVNLCFWGPLPLAWLWIGGRTQYLTDSIFGGLTVAFATMIGGLLLGLMALKRLDYAWILVRRAAGHDQREGMIGRIFMICCMIGAADLRHLVPVLQRRADGRRRRAGHDGRLTPPP